MAAGAPTLASLISAIVDGDTTLATRLLTASPGLATARLEAGALRETAKENFFESILHYQYEGDTALHLAAAAYRHALAQKLLAKGADIHAKNRRKAEPLHYAVDGGPGAPHWNPETQVKTLVTLLEAGADPNAMDMGGVTPFHRAVRNRCSAAVKALLAGGADPLRKNKNGSTALTLVTQTTGRGGTGTRAAKAEQEHIVRLLAPFA